MKKIVAIMISVGMSASLFALPPKIKQDQYMQGLDQSIASKNNAETQRYLKKLDALKQNYKLELPARYNYFKAEVSLENKKYKEANAYVEKYLDKTGTKGKFYRQSLDILNEIEKRMKITYVKTDNLMWQDEVYTKEENTAYADGYGAHKVQDWSGAKTYCSKLNLEGHADWRLASKSELKTLYKNKVQVVNIMPERYWSSTVPAVDTTDAWSVRFDDGNTNYYNKDNFYYVRCVRNEK
jgi:hypothetical protein